MSDTKYLMTDYKIRPIKESEYGVMPEMLYHAVFQRPGAKPLSKKIIVVPEIFNYIDNFGGLEDDYCLVADRRGAVVGAVWIRILAGEIKGYGNVNDKTPEFAISVLPEFRNHGIGIKLMRTMLGYMRRKGYAQASLSVQKENYAYKMYKKLGFETVKENEEDYIMIKNLKS